MYKRQVNGPELAVIQIQGTPFIHHTEVTGRETGKFIQEFPVFLMIPSVSYTHLDVYKRQQESMGGMHHHLPFVGQFQEIIKRL